MVLAFEGVDVGRRMLAWAAQYALFPDDEVFVVHCNKARPAALAPPNYKPRIEHNTLAKGIVFSGAPSRGARARKLITAVLRGDSCRCYSTCSARGIDRQWAHFRTYFSALFRPLLQGPRAAVKGARKAAAAAAAAASAAAATDPDDEDVGDEVLAAVTEELPKMHVALCIQLKARKQHAAMPPSCVPCRCSHGRCRTGLL